MMERYYRMLPRDTLEAFLTCNGAVELRSREICPQRRRDVPMQRYVYGSDGSRRPLRFECINELVMQLVRSAPVTVHVGPAWPANMDDRRAERASDTYARIAPLVFDVDLDAAAHAGRAQLAGCPCDFARKECCDVCWVAFMTPAMMRMRALLCDTLGFAQVLFFFSGRRGFHVWVMDPEALAMGNEERGAMARLALAHGVAVDEGVTANCTHLLKMPLMPHPATGRVVTPIAHDRLVDFLPSWAPLSRDVDPDMMAEFKRVMDGKLNVPH